MAKLFQPFHSTNVEFDHSMRKINFTAKENGGDRVRGQLPYIAPELFTTMTTDYIIPCTPQADVYAFG